MFMIISIIGFLAAFTSVISLIPQIIKIYQSRSTADISVLMLCNFLLTSVLWIIYGAMIISLEVIVANVLMGIFSIWVLILKFYYD